MLARAAHTAIRRRRAVLVLFLLALGLFGAVGGGVAKHLSANGGFDDPGSQSSRARVALERDLGQGEPQLILVVGRGSSSVDDRVTKQQGVALTGYVRDQLRREAGTQQAAGVLSYWSTPLSPLRSRDGTRALITARLSTDHDRAVDLDKVIGPRIQAKAAQLGLTVQATGLAAVFRDVSERIERDLIRAEAIAVPVTAILLILVFGSAIAALLPLAIGVMSVLGTFFALRLLVNVTAVSVYSTNLATSLGLGLGIDYGLFILTRYREELAGGLPAHDAIVQRVRPAGRTVLVSAVTVAAALASLLLFPLYFLKSFGYAGIVGTAMAAFGALVVLPALIALLGTRLDSLDLRKPLRRILRFSPPVGPEAGSPFWHRVATLVMKRAGLLGATVVALLLFAGVPFTQVVFGLPDDRVLPADASPHRASDVLRSQFVAGGGNSLYVVAPREQVSPAATNAYAVRLSALRDVARVDSAVGSFVAGRAVASGRPEMSTPKGSYVYVVPAVESQSDAGKHLAEAVRATPAPYSHPLVGGDAAQLRDSLSSIGGSLLPCLLLIALATFTVLFTFTGSVVLPVKAIVMTMLSLSATFGVLVWGFQDGHLAGLLGFQQTGMLDTTTPILMFCLVFGLSMDYEVFLLARIKEERDRGAGDDEAVAVGLEKTGRLVTAAAMLLAIVFVAFASSSITFIKLLGVGAALAIVLDATVVRGILVPSFMKMLGARNWWAPGPLRRLHERYGLSEAPAAPRVVKTDMVDA
jgi:RND superfamily putative drug exporter